MSAAAEADGGNQPADNGAGAWQYCFPEERQHPCLDGGVLQVVASDPSAVPSGTADVPLPTASGSLEVSRSRVVQLASTLSLIHI